MKKTVKMWAVVRKGETIDHRDCLFFIKKYAELWRKQSLFPEWYQVIPCTLTYEH